MLINIKKLGDFELTENDYLGCSQLSGDKRKPLFLLPLVQNDRILVLSVRFLKKSFRIKTLIRQLNST